MSRFSLALALSLAVSTAAVASAQDTTRAPAKPVTRSDLKGEWTGTVVLENSSPQVALVFQVSDTTLTGEAFADGRLFGPMTDLTLVGNKVHFKVSTLDFTGVVTGARMKVDLIVYNGSTKTIAFVHTP